MSKIVDKSLILNAIKSHLGFAKDVDFAKYLNIPASTLGSWYARNTFDYELLYAKCNDINGNWLITGKGSMLKENELTVIKHEGLPLIPIGAMAGMADGDKAVLELECEHYYIPEFQNKADYLIRISGNSMYPKYHNGDIVACKKIPTKTFIQWGKVYIMDTIQGALCKRLMESDKGEAYVDVVSDNDKVYKPFSMARKEIRALAIVVGVIRME